MEKSIEEDIKNAEHFIKSIKTDKEYKEENGWHGYYNKEIVELARMLEHILSDYKRVLKENEELLELKVSASAHNRILELEKENKNLKEEKEQAWEEWNNLEQGSYETEQKIKQQIKELQKENEKKDKIIDLMANHIATSDSDLCEYLDITVKCKYYAGDNGKTCDNCIKQYFENKAKEV